MTTAIRDVLIVYIATKRERISEIGRMIMNARSQENWQGSVTNESISSLQWGRGVGGSEVPETESCSSTDK